VVVAAAVKVPELSYGQSDAVYNLFSLAIASLGFTGLYLVLSQRRVAAPYRNAIVVSAMVCFIATYHYFRIFDNLKHSYLPTSQGGSGPYVLSNLARSVARPLLTKLVIASGLMIALGYPGEVAGDNATRLLWGTLSTIPFIYLLYVLFVELSKSLDRQPVAVRGTVSKLRIMLIGLWGVYPIAYLFPVFGFDGANAFVLRQAGYSIADILAKAAFGLVIFKIARVKSEAADPAYADAEAAAAVSGQARSQPRGARIPA